MRSRLSRRVPTVTQLTQTECGLCSCVALLRYHGRAEEISSARAAMDVGRDGLSASQLARFLRTRGMAAKLFRARSVDALKGFDSPAILYWEDYHFLILERFDGERAIVMDPAVGRRRMTCEELDRGFSGIVIAAEPTEDFVRVRARPFADWSSLPVFPKGSITKVIFVALLSLGGYGATLGVPILTQWVVDRHMEWQGFGDISSMIGVVLGFSLAFFILHITRVVILAGLVHLLGDHLMSYSFSKLLSLPYRFFSTRQPGELLFRLNTVNAVRDLLSSRIAQGILDIGMLLCVSIYLFAIEWRLGSLALSLVLVNAFYLTKKRMPLMEIVDSELSHLSKSQSIQLDAIVSIPAIKMGGYSDEFLKTWKKNHTASLDAMKSRILLQQGWIGGLNGVTQTFGPALLLLAGLYFVNQGQITLGSAVAVQAISATYFTLSASVFQTYTEFTEASRYMARLNDISLTPSEGPGGSLVRVEDTSIRLDRLSFRYSKHSEFVVRDVSMDIEAGARIALVGPSGSGKSTLGRIVCGLDDPTHGKVLIGGRETSEYRRDQLRRAIGYIPQEVHLHNRTILENLTFGQDLPVERVREYCKAVGILDFLEGLPMGLQTLVSEMGANFSGGQRQRIAIVRALLRQPKILVMDEATASLDNVNEQRVAQIIKDIGATQLIIAHRLATIKSADRIYVLDQGRVIEQGSHEELLNSGLMYTDLYSDNYSDALAGGNR